MHSDNEQSIPEIGKKYAIYAADYSHGLSVSELNVLQKHYKSKLNINIIINGQTEGGRAIIETKRKELNNQMQQFNQAPYANYLLKFYCEPKESFFGAYAELGITENSEFSDFYEFLAKLYKSNKQGNLDIGVLNAEIENNQNCAEIFKKYIEDYNNLLIEGIQDVSLTPEECEIEVKEIQKTLPEDTQVGYLFTSNHSVNAGHVEAAIVSSDKIIKPNNWGEQRHGNIEWDGVYQTQDAVFGADGYKPRAQAGTQECGTLSILYLKELLKNQAQQLHQYCLSFNCSATYGSTFFFPSPQVLRYSQSGLYNKCIIAMLDDQSEQSEPVVVKHKGKSVRVTTLKTILTDSLKLHPENQELLDNLSSFKKQWLKCINTTKRNDFQGPTTNEYLKARSIKMANTVEKHNTSLEILKQDAVHLSDKLTIIMQNNSKETADPNKKAVAKKLNKELSAILQSGVDETVFVKSIIDILYKTERVMSHNRHLWHWRSFNNTETNALKYLRPELSALRQSLQKHDADIKLVEQNVIINASAADLRRLANIPT